MSFLYFLEGLRNPVLDFIMSAITYIGDEAAFLVIALTVYWCLDKRRGYYLMTVGFFGVIINQTLKLIFRIPRPWILDKNFTIVESARGAATGYSFPSGHTQNAVGTLGGVARTFKHLGWRIAMVVCAILVAFSRMYLGVHTPLDVGISLLVGVLLIFLLYPVFEYTKKHPNAMYVLLGSFILISIAFLIFTYTINLPDGTADEIENLMSGRKTAFTMIGATLGMIAGYALDRHVVKFDEKATVWGQIVKLAVGMVVVLAIKSGLKALFGGNDEAFVLRAVRYFIVVLLAAGVYPITFKYFAKIGSDRKKAEVKSAEAD